MPLNNAKIAKMHRTVIPQLLVHNNLVIPALYFTEDQRQIIA